MEQGDLGSTALRTDGTGFLYGRLGRVRGALSPPRREPERLVLALLLVDLLFAALEDLDFVEDFSSFDPSAASIKARRALRSARDSAMN